MQTNFMATTKVSNSTLLRYLIDCFKHELQNDGLEVMFARNLPIRMSNVRTVPSTLPPIISVFVKQTDITLSANVSIICMSIETLD